MERQDGKDFKYKIQLNTGYSDNEILVRDWDQKLLIRAIRRVIVWIKASGVCSVSVCSAAIRILTSILPSTILLPYMGNVKEDVKPGMLIYKDVRGARQDDGTYTTGWCG